MKRGLIITLLAAAASVTGIQAVYANAPTISALPDITIGDAEDNNGFTDNNYFVYTNAFSLDAKADDPGETPDASLLWSFAEEGSALWFHINGKPANGAAGNAGIAAAFAAAATADAAHNLRVGPNAQLSDPVYATFRDVVLSPGDGPLTSAFPVNGALAAHQAGKFVWFFVSDGVNVTSATSFVKVLDNGSDAKSPASDFVPVSQTQFPTNPTGFWNADLTGGSAGTGDYEGSSGSLRLGIATANPAATEGNKYRVIGWRELGKDENAASTDLKYSQIPANSDIRAKFLVFAENTTGGSTVTDINTIPNMRLRVSGQAFSYAAFLDLQHHNVGSPTFTGPAQDMAPSTNPLTPTVYRVDMSPPAVAAYISDPTNLGFDRAIEAYGKSDQPQENGKLCLTETVIGYYTRPSYTTLSTFAGADTNLTPGTGGLDCYGIVYPFDLSLAIQSAVHNGAAFTTFPLTPTSQISFTPSASGFTASTEGVDSLGQRISVVTVDWVNGVVGETNATRARVELGKQYRVRFAATSTIASSVQALVRFRSSSMGFAYNPRLEIGSAKGSAHAWTYQYLPGVGGWGNTSGNTYDLVWVSPFTVNPSVMGLATGTHLGAQPGPGNAGASTRDIYMGFDIIDDISASPELVKGRVTLTGVTIQSASLVSD